MSNGIPLVPPLLDIRAGDDALLPLSRSRRARAVSDSEDADGRTAARAHQAASDADGQASSAPSTLPPTSCDQSRARQRFTSSQGAMTALSTASAPSASQGSVDLEEPSFIEENLLKLGGKSFIDIPQFTQPSEEPSPHTLRHAIGANITVLADQIVNLQESSRARDADIAGLTQVLHGDEGPKDDLRRMRKDIDSLRSAVASLCNANLTMTSRGTDFVSLATFRSFYDHCSQIAAGIEPVVKRSGGIEKELTDLTKAAASLQGQSLAPAVTGSTSLSTAVSSDGPPGRFAQAFSPQAAADALHGHLLHRGGRADRGGWPEGGGTMLNASGSFRDEQAQPPLSSHFLTLSHVYCGPIHKKDVSAIVMTDAVCNMLQVKLSCVKSASYIFEGKDCLVLVCLASAQCCQEFVAAWLARRDEVSVQTLGLADGFDVWPALDDVGDWRTLLGPSSGHGAGGSEAAAGSGPSRYGLS